jgi:hypothetical protein
VPRDELAEVALLGVLSSIRDTTEIHKWSAN